MPTKIDLKVKRAIYQSWNTHLYLKAGAFESKIAIFYRDNKYRKSQIKSFDIAAAKKPSRDLRIILSYGASFFLCKLDTCPKNLTLVNPNIQSTRILLSKKRKKQMFQHTGRTFAKRLGIAKCDCATALCAKYTLRQCIVQFRISAAECNCNCHFSADRERVKAVRKDVPEVHVRVEIPVRSC